VRTRDGFDVADGDVAPGQQAVTIRMQRVLSIGAVLALTALIVLGREARRAKD
jgi:hypothetical protein